MAEKRTNAPHEQDGTTNDRMRTQGGESPRPPDAVDDGDVHSGAFQAAEATNTTTTEPAPYDLAAPGTPDDKVIKKGEHERPGPTDESGGKGRSKEHVEESGKVKGDEYSRRLSEVEATGGPSNDDYRQRRGLTEH